MKNGAGPTEVRVVVLGGEDPGELADFLFGDDAFSVRSVATGREALEELDRFKPHAVVVRTPTSAPVDLRIASQLRASPVGHRLCLVLIGGSLRDTERAIDAGFDYHLIEPVEPLVVEGLLMHHVRSGSTGQQGN